MPLDDILKMKPINRKYLKHGDIVEIKLPNLKTNICAKIIDPIKSNSSLDLPLFLRLYNYQFLDLQFERDKLSYELLVDPFWIVGQSAAINKYNWKILMNEEVKTEEYFFPDTKSQWPQFAKEFEYWVYFERFGGVPIRSTYDKVGHLNLKNGKHISIVPLIAEIELLKIIGKDYKELFLLKDYLDEVTYSEYSSIPIYTKLPENIKGRHIS